MSNNVDRRIVEMQFDNKQFESHAQASIETLNKLKKSLDFKDSTKGFSELDRAAKTVNLDSLIGAAEAVSRKFSIVGTVADQVFRQITNGALNAAARVKGFIEELTTKPVSTGFDEYETQINAIQTIMSNTRDQMTSAGYSDAERLEIVNDRLDQLNHYADKTIYNFTEMTRNIGTFTAAGVELDTAVNSIQGIANLAAVSGSNSEQASRAMYQLSQAISTGTVKLMDWNSVVNAGMGGELFQKALMRTAKAMGVTGEEAQEVFTKLQAGQINFRDSLSSGWLTADVLTATLEQFSWDFEQMAKDMGYTAADMEAGILQAMEVKRGQLLAEGYTPEEAEEILQLAKDATEAATKVKTFTQLFDTLKEAAQSGWTQTWEYIIGNFEEAKELLTSISDFFGGLIDASSEARNQLMSGWKDLGGRNELISSFWNIVYTIQNIANLIRGEFEKFFPPKTSEQLYNMTQKFREFTEKLRTFTENSETMEKFRRIVAGVAAAFDLLKKVISWAWNGFKKLLGITESTAGGLLDLAASIGDFFVNTRNSIGKSKILQSMLTSLGEAATSVKNLFSKAFVKISSVLSSLWANVKESDILMKMGIRMSEFIGKIPAFIQKIQAWSKTIIDYVKNSEMLKKAWSNVKGFFSSTFEKISDFTEKIKEAIREFFSADTSGEEGFWGKLKARLSSGFSAFSSWFDEAKGKLLEAWEKIKGVFADFFTQSIPTFFSELSEKVNSAVTSIASVDWGRIITTVLGGLVAIKFASFLGSFSKIAKGFNQIGKGFDKLGELFDDFRENGIRYTRTDISKNVDSIGTTLLKIAGSIGILVASILVLSKMDTADILKSLATIGALGAELVIICGLCKAGTVDGKSLLMMAAGISLMIIPIKILAKMNTEDALKGILGIGLIMTEIALFGKIAGEGFSGKTGFLSLSAGVNLLVIAVKQLAGMNIGELIKGVSALGVIFLELSAFAKMAGNKKVKGLISMAAALNLMVIAVKTLGKMSKATLAKGVLAINGLIVSFAILAKTAGTMSFGKSLTTLLTIAGTLALFVGAFKEIDGLNISSMLSFSGSLSSVLLSLAISMKLLGSMPISGALMGVTNMAIAIGGIGAIIVGLGALKDNWAGMTGLLESGGEVFRLIGSALGQFIGGIGSGIVDGLDLPAMGTQLSDFMTNARGFLDGAKNIDESTKTGVGNLTAAIGAIADSEFKTWLVSLFKKDNPITAFSDDIQKLGSALSKYGLSVLPLAIIPTSVLNKSVSVASALTDVATKIPPTGSFAQFLHGIGNMNTFSSNLTGLGGALAGFAVEISKVSGDFDNAKITTVVSIATALAGLNTSLPKEGGLLQAITGVQSLSNFGGQTQSFGDGITAFLTEVSKLPVLTDQDQNKINTVISVGNALSSIEQGLEAQGGLTDKIEGVKSLSVFSTGFKPFGDGLNDFIGQVRLVTYDPNGDDADKMAAVVAIATSLAELEKGLEPQGGIADDFKGIKSLATFGGEIPDFATALNSFIETVATLEDEKYDQTKINNALAVAQGISDLEAKLPATDGWWQSIVGNKDLSLFSTNITQLGTALSSFAGDIATVNMGNSESAISVMGLIGDFIASLDETGGLWDNIGKWFGGSSENTLLSTTQTMAQVGTNLNTFATSLTGISFDGKIDDASKIFTDMQAFVANLDPSGTIWQAIAKIFAKGDSSKTLITISEAMGTFGTNMRTFSDGIADAGTAKNAFEDAKALFVGFKMFNDTLTESTGTAWQLGDLGEGLAGFGTYLSAFAINISGVNVSDLSGAVSTINTLISIASAAGGVDPANVQNLAAVLEEYAKTDFSTAGHTLGGGFITEITTAINAGQLRVENCAKQLSLAGSTGIEATYPAWNEMGKYLGEGLADGISGSAYVIKRAAINAAAGATKAIQTIWDIHSPSRVGKGLGMNFDLGIAGGVDEYAPVVVHRMGDMAQKAVKSAKTMLRGANSSIFDNLDPNPTIRPVLDLSNVQRGVNSIESMFASPAVLNTELFKGINVRQNAGMLNFDGAKILGSQSNKDVVTELKSLTDKFNTLSEAVTNMKVVLDSGELVGATSNKMDRQLGTLAMRKGRGN